MLERRRLLSPVAGPVTLLMTLPAAAQVAEVDIEVQPWEVVGR